MSTDHLATTLVVPFEHLRMTDVEAVGGKNASLGEMISQLTSSGVRVPGGFATTAHAFRRFLAHEGLAARIEARLAALNTDDVRALAEAGAQIRQWVIDTPLPADLEAAVRSAFEALVAGDSSGDLRGALVGHGRGPARRLVRRPAGDLPERARHRRGAAPHEGGVRVALQRPRDQLPGAQGICPCRCGVVGRRAAHGALRHRLGRRDVHDRHRKRLQGRGLHHLELRPGRDGGAGRRQPRRVLRPQAGTGGRQAGGDPAQPGLQADPHGVHHRSRKRRPAASWSRPSTTRPSCATAIR